MKLILASKSAARQAMLEAVGLSFETAAGDLDEEAEKEKLKANKVKAAGLASALAEWKALSVAANGYDLVLGADQTLERDDGNMLDKPSSRDDAMTQLKSLSGRTHHLHAAAVIVEAGRAIWRHTETVALTMRPLSDAFLRAYLKREYEAIRHNVGCYRIEGPGVQLFERIEGSHFAILGLPLLPLLAYLRERGVVAS